MININKLEAKDVLPNINRTQAAERAEKFRFRPWWLLTFDLYIQTCPSERPNTSSLWIGANPFSGSRDISRTNKKVTDSVKKEP